MIKKIAKKIINNNNFLSKIFHEYGWLKYISLRCLWINYFFRVIFRRNSNSPFSVHFTSQIICPEKIHFNGVPAKPLSSFAMSGGCYIQAGNGIEIGEGTIWAPNVAIVSANHDPNQPDMKWKKDAPIVIGRNCWIGTGAVILPGVTIGDNTIVGAGAVVTRSYPNGNITLVGTPARHLGRKNEA